jgi:hypothetical protein
VNSVDMNSLPEVPLLLTLYLRPSKVRPIASKASSYPAESAVSLPVVAKVRISLCIGGNPSAVWCTGFWTSRTASTYSQEIEVSVLLSGSFRSTMSRELLDIATRGIDTSSGWALPHKRPLFPVPPPVMQKHVQPPQSLEKPSVGNRVRS